MGTNRLSSVSFFCPAYGDAENLPLLIPNVHQFLTEYAEQFEIIIVDDGSPDATGSVADELARTLSYTRVIHHPHNRGYGAALKTGFFSARYDYVMYTDGDNQYDIREFGPALHLLQAADVISGYAGTKAVTLKRKIQSWIFNICIWILFGYFVRDINCAMKVYKRAVLSAIDIRSDSAFIDAEMILKAKAKGFIVRQFLVTHYPRRSGAEGGSKWSVIRGTIVDMIKFRFGRL